MWLTASVAEGGEQPKPKPVVVRGAGDIAPTIERYQKPLVPDTGVVAATSPPGRREIYWAAVPDELSQPNGYPPDFLNAPAEPRARGAVLSTPGDHLGVSAD